MAFLNRTVINIIKLGRLRFLWLGFSLYLLGTLLAVASGAAFGIDRFVFGYLVLMTGHLSVHYSNDYFDYEVDSRTAAGTLSGGSGILPKYPQLRSFAKWFGLSLAVLSVGLGAIFTIVFAFPLTYLGFAVFGNLLSWYYTAPPVRLAYRGFSELATMTAVGFLMPAIGDFSQSGVAFSPLFLVFLVPLLLYSLSFIINVEVPDMEGDIAGGKRNFIVRKGRAAGFLAIGLLCTLATVFLAALSVGHFQIDFEPALLFSLIPLLPALSGMIRRPTDRGTAVKLVQINVGCFLLFILLMDAYLVFIHL
ncbi:MAG TPA: prenyltransferase [Methanocella sp.]|jgi:1,4-dihydroxy-2-naphthoate octaprenyltransferase